ncbi:MAG TPA: Rrf2 family transcriptional regulator [Bacteroidales bacterium]|nr:Rrf2 family transcriptional regulator [Bacteroidales bacterium]
MAKLVHFSEAASLALHAMVIIAQNNIHVNVNYLSEEMGASRNHLAKVLQQLVKFNYLRSVRGPNGGFVLNKPAHEISILNIYEAIEGKIDTPECPLDRPICPFDKCLMGGLIKDVTLQFKAYFNEQTLQSYLPPRVGS